MKHVKRITISIPINKTVPVTGTPEAPATGFMSVFSHYEERVVEVEVDYYALAKTLGPKAVASKGGKAKEASGAVVVKYVG